MVGGPSYFAPYRYMSLRIFNKKIFPSGKLCVTYRILVYLQCSLWMKLIPIFTKIWSFWKLKLTVLFLETGPLVALIQPDRGSMLVGCKQTGYYYHKGYNSFKKLNTFSLFHRVLKNSGIHIIFINSQHYFINTSQKYSLVLTSTNTSK